MGLWEPVVESGTRVQFMLMLSEQVFGAGRTGGGEPRSQIQPNEALAAAQGILIARIEPVVPAVRKAQLEADRDTLRLLQLEEFKGPEWAKVQRRLWLYAYNTFPSKVFKGEVFKLVRALGIPPTRDLQLSVAPRLVWQDAVDITVDTIGEALPDFKAMLAQGGWDPYRAEVCCLDSFFFGKCLFEFPAVWRKRLRQLQARDATEVLSGALDDALGDHLRHLADPELQAVTRVEVEQGLALLPKRFRDVVVLDAHGFTGKEVADQLGLGESQAEYRLKVGRKRLGNLRELHDDVA